jgi:ketosteroid isomerase-like protein
VRLLRIAAFVCVAKFCAVGAALGQVPRPAVEAELRALNSRVVEMQLRHDVATANRLLSDEYLFIQADGQVTNKAQNIAVIGSPDFVCSSLATTGVEVRVYGDTALVMGRASMKATFRGQDVGGEFRYTDVWVKRGSEWTNVASQATRIPKN